MKALALNLSSLNLAALSFGDESKPPLLALHGWLDNAASFTYLAPLLTDYHVIAVDLPGHGHSDHRSPQSRYLFMEYIADIAAIIAYFQWPRVSLLGHSLGGCIASIYAGINPKQIDRLLLIDAIGAITPPPNQAPEQARRSLLAYQKQILPPNSFADIDSAIAKRVKNSGLSIAAATPIVERALIKQAQNYAWRHDPRLLLPSLISLTNDQSNAFLNNISAKTLLIHPEPGYGFPADIFGQRGSLIKDFQTIKITGNHYPHLEQAIQVAGIINNA